MRTKTKFHEVTALNHLKKVIILLLILSINTVLFSFDTPVNLSPTSTLLSQGAFEYQLRQLEYLKNDFRL